MTEKVIPYIATKYSLRKLFQIKWNLQEASQAALSLQLEKRQFNMSYLKLEKVYKDAVATVNQKIII